jgi:hypothetical protein
MVILFLEELLGSIVITGEGTVLHLPKQSPFTTKTLAMFLVLNKFDVSLYTKPNYLPSLKFA